MRSWVSHRCRLGLEPASDDRLAVSRSINVCDVQEVDSRLYGAVHQGKRLLFCLTHAREAGVGSDPTEVGAAETES